LVASNFELADDQATCAVDRKRRARPHFFSPGPPFGVTPNTPGPVGARGGGLGALSRIAMAWARRLQSIESPRRRAASCGAWKPMELPQATKSRRQADRVCSARIGASWASVAPAALASRMASSMSVIASAARSISALVVVWIQSTRATSSVSGTLWQVWHERLALSRGLRTQWELTLVAPSRSYGMWQS